MTKILLVDDEPDVPYTIKNILEDNGFAVDTFNDPILALNCTRRNLEKLDWHLVKQLVKSILFKKPIKTEDLLKKLTSIMNI